MQPHPRWELRSALMSVLGLLLPFAFSVPSISPSHPEIIPEKFKAKGSRVLIENKALLSKRISRFYSIRVCVWHVSRNLSGKIVPAVVQQPFRLTYILGERGLFSHSFEPMSAERCWWHQGEVWELHLHPLGSMLSLVCGCQPSTAATGNKLTSQPLWAIRSI